ncbi:MAG: MazG nucleotide pyrophosphohydrolase domain-containing protein [Mycobacteriales bacterium]
MTGDAVTGAALLELVALMDRLRSPGGCPWDAAQTHRTLTPYLLEEAYEAHQALVDDDPGALREELGDVLLQVVFHARLGEEAEPAWSIDDVAGDLIAKLVRRHPHVFPGRDDAATPRGVDRGVTDAARVLANWDVIKRAEKQRESILDGVPAVLPALMLADTLARKAARAGVPADLLPDADSHVDPDADGVGSRLFAAVVAARRAGEDAEGALRSVGTAFRDRVTGAERAARADGVDPSTLDAAGWRRYWPA